MSGTIVHEEGSHRVVALGNNYGVGYRWLLVEQTYVAFGPDGVAFSQIDSATGNVLLSLTLEEMATLVASYQTYLTDREKRQNADDECGELEDHPF